MMCFPPRESRNGSKKGLSGFGVHIEKLIDVIDVIGPANLLFIGPGCG